MAAHSDDVLFIHIPKCGGWSVKRWLKATILGFVLPEDEPGKWPMGHTALRDIEQWTGRRPDSYRKIIAIVRNPYERELSEWFYRRDRFAKGHRHGFDAIAAAHTNLTSFMLDPFSEWHRLNYEAPGQQRATRDADATTYATYGGFWMYWLAIDGTIPPNVQMLRQETLATELPNAVAEFTEGELPEVPLLNATSHDEAMRYHTPISVQLTEHRCKWAFDNFYERFSERDTK